MVVRREAGSLVTYCHVGTGNYHPVTAKIYTDISFFTADPVIGRDVSRIFNYITGYAEPGGLERMSVSPISLKQRLLEHIAQEIAFVKAGKPGAIWAKCNALVDPEIIDAFYEASNAGVDIDLVVRGIRCLRPGVEGLSENIRVQIDRWPVSGTCPGLLLRRRPRSSAPQSVCLYFVGRFDAAQSRPGESRRCCLFSTRPCMSRSSTRSWWPICSTISRATGSCRMDRASASRRQNEEPFNAHSYFMTNPSLSGRGKSLKNSSPKTLLERLDAR